MPTPTPAQIRAFKRLVRSGKPFALAEASRPLHEQLLRMHRLGQI